MTPPSVYDSERPSQDVTRMTGSANQGFATTALILGAWAFLTGLVPVAGLLASIGAILFGVFALRRNQRKGLAITGLTLGSVAAFTSLIVTVVFLSAAGAPSNQPDKVASAIEKAQSSLMSSVPTPSVDSGIGFYCDHITLHFQQVVNVIAAGGETATVKDILDKLKEEGDAFSNGFDATMVGSEENAALVRDAGQAMLELRVALTNGSEDALVISDRLLEDFKQVKAICGGN